MKCIPSILHRWVLMACVTVTLLGHPTFVSGAPDEKIPTVPEKPDGIIRQSSKNYTEERIQELRKKFMDNFPSYLIGYDYEEAPVFLFPFGKYKYTEIPEEDVQAFIDFLDWLVNTVIRQVADKSEQGVGFLMDMEGFSLNNFGSTRAMRVALNLFQFTGKISAVLKYGIIINGNFATQIFVNIARPFLGDFAGRIEVHGNVKERWIPRLLRRIPADQLPPQYGGDASKFKMVEYYG